MKLKVSDTRFIYLALCLANSIDRAHKTYLQLSFFNYTQMNLQIKKGVSVYHSFSIIKSS